MSLQLANLNHSQAQSRYYDVFDDLTPLERIVAYSAIEEMQPFNDDMKNPLGTSVVLQAKLINHKYFITKQELPLSIPFCYVLDPLQANILLYEQLSESPNQ